MSLPVQDIEAQLLSAPEDWSLRMRLIEARVRDGNMAEARRLVRESPDEAPLPQELQFRLHALMTQGAAALEDLETGDEWEQAPAASEYPERETEAQGEFESRDLPLDPAESVPARKQGPPEPPHHHNPLPGNEDVSEPQREPASPRSPVQPVHGKPLDLESLWESESRRWADYDGDLQLEVSPSFAKQRKQVQVAQKVSAFSFALLMHLVFFLLVGFIVVTIPRPRPPQLIATVKMPEFDDVFVPPRKLMESDKKPASASAASPNVIGALGPSPVSIPEMENTNAVDVTSLITGTAAVGDGVSFAGDSREVSDVNFFGIMAGGKRIVLIIDATPEMLVDEKGGMYAYDKVKNEIAVMLAGLNRGTKFNLLLYERNRLMAFAEEPVVAMPSNLRLASEWLNPLNRTYEELGLGGHRGEMLQVDEDIEPIAARDVAHYTKAIQKAIEWQASTIFCISAGYRRIDRSPTPEEMEKYMKAREANPGTPGTVDPAERESWNRAIQKTRDWLRKENEARRKKDLPPKVVINFNALVREITGAAPPRATGGAPGAERPRPMPYTPGDIEDLVKNGVHQHFREAGLDPPSIHMVVFLGEDEDMDGATRDHFKNLTRRNNGKFKELRGLAALENVTGR